MIDVKHTETNVNYIDPNAEAETVSPHVDHLIECPVCGEFRHKSWFRVGARSCWGCETHHRLWSAALQEALREADGVVKH